MLSTLKRSLPHLISSVPSSQFLSESQRRSVLKHLPEGQLKYSASATSHDVWPEDKRANILSWGAIYWTRQEIVHSTNTYFSPLQLNAMTLTVYTKNAIVCWKKLRPKTLMWDPPVSQKQYNETRALQNSDPLRINTWYLCKYCTKTTSLEPRQRTKTPTSLFAWS